MTKSDDREYLNIMSELIADERIRKMADFRQHGNVSTFDHCRRVARLSYLIDKKLSLGCDLEELLKGAMLHDYYLYDWHEDDWKHGLHGYTHPQTAGDNAKKHFGINEKIENMIKSHMWPLDPRKIPGSKEAWVICLADKIASARETVLRR